MVSWSFWCCISVSEAERNEGKIVNCLLSTSKNNYCFKTQTGLCRNDKNDELMNLTISKCYQRAFFRKLMIQDLDFRVDNGCLEYYGDV